MTCVKILARGNLQFISDHRSSIFTVDIKSLHTRVRMFNGRHPKMRLQQRLKFPSGIMRRAFFFFPCVANSGLVWRHLHLQVAAQKWKRKMSGTAYWNIRILFEVRVIKWWQLCCLPFFNVSLWFILNTTIPPTLFISTPPPKKTTFFVCLGDKCFWNDLLLSTFFTSSHSGFWTRVCGSTIQNNDDFSNHLVFLFSWALDWLLLMSRTIKLNNFSLVLSPTKVPQMSQWVGTVTLLTRKDYFCFWLWQTVRFQKENANRWIRYIRA